MSITISNLEVIISSFDSSQQYIQFRADVDNNSGEDILDTKLTYINVSLSGGLSEQLADRFEVPNGNTVTILSRRQLIDVGNTLAEFQFVFPVASANQVTVFAADAFIYNPFETRLELDMWQLELSPTRAGFRFNPDNWFASAQTTFRNYFLESYELRKIGIRYDDGTTSTYTLPAQTYIVAAQANITSSLTTYVEVDSYPGGTNTPLRVRMDKGGVTAINYTLTPTDRWEPYELLASPANVQNNYQLMQLELTTTGNSIYLNVTRGVAPYSYLWNDGATSQNRENVAPGLYAVTVTDDLGYTAQASVQLGDLHYFSENPVTLKVNIPDRVGKKYLRTVCEVWIERKYLSDSYEKLFEAEQPLDSQGNTVFDVRQILDSFLAAQLPGTSLQRQDNQFKRFYLRYFERYGDPETTVGVTQVQENYLLMGGISELEYARGNFFGLHFAQKPFYTWQPLNKEVYADQPEYLLFVVNSFDYTAFDVCVNLFHIQPDGSEDSSEYVIFSQSGVIKYEPYLFPVGPDQLNLLDYHCEESGTQLDRYEVYVKSGAQIVSEIRTYILNYEYNLYRRYFLFQNSLSGWDTLATTGKAEERVSVDTETLERYLPPDHGPLERKTQVVNRTAEPEVRVSLGYKNKEMMRALQDFLVAHELYLVAHNNGLQLSPVELDIRNATILDEDEDLQTFDFAYRLPTYSRYTPQLIAPANPAVLISASAEVVDDSITLTVVGGQPPYIFAWSDGNTDQNRTGLTNGTYSVLVRDSSSPRQAYTLCNLEITQGVDAALPETQAWTYDSALSEEAGTFDQTAPGYYFNWPEFLSPVSNWGNAELVRNIELRPGINRIEISFLFPLGSEGGQVANPDINCNIDQTYQTEIQGVDLTVKGTWQKAITEINVPSTMTGVTARAGFQMKLNTVNQPTFYISDFKLIWP